MLFDRYVVKAPRRWHVTQVNPQHYNGEMEWVVEFVTFEDAGQRRPRASARVLATFSDAQLKAMFGDSHMALRRRPGPLPNSVIRALDLHR